MRNTSKKVTANPKAEENSIIKAQATNFTAFSRDGKNGIRLSVKSEAGKTIDLFTDFTAGGLKLTNALVNVETIASLENNSLDQSSILANAKIEIRKTVAKGQSYQTRDGKRHIAAQDYYSVISTTLTDNGVQWYAITVLESLNGIKKELLKRQFQAQYPDMEIE